MGVTSTIMLACQPCSGSAFSWRKTLIRIWVGLVKDMVEGGLMVRGVCEFEIRGKQVDS